MMILKKNHECMKRERERQTDSLVMGNKTLVKTSIETEKEKEYKPFASSPLSLSLKMIVSVCS